MVLGTANFGNSYKGVILHEEQCFELLEYFENNGGKIIDTATDYGNSEEIIKSYFEDHARNLKIITKVNKTYKESMFKDSELYGVLYRNKINKEITSTIKGQSIYYSHELDQRAKIIQIPAAYYFADYLQVMSLQADVYVRSYYTMDNPVWVHQKEYRRYIKDFVVGCDNLEQLKINMEKFQ